MGTVTAATIINRAAYLLEDTGNTTWTRGELLEWVNEGQIQVVAFAPGANTNRVNHVLAAGTQQTLPSDALVLIDIPRNVNGPAVRVTTRELLDGGPVDWHTATATATVTNYLYDANDQYNFYVYPPNTGAGQVVLVYASVPTALSNEAQTIEVDDSYAAAIVNYALYRAYSKDTDYTSDGAAKATGYYSAFKDVIAGRNALQNVVNSNNALAPVNANVQGSLR